MENPPYALSKSKHRREPAYRFRCRFPPSVQTYAEKTNESYAEKVWSTLIGEMIQISFAHVWHCPPSVKSPHVLVSHGGVIKQHPACLVIFFEWMRNANSLLVCVANEEFALNVAIMPFGMVRMVVNKRASDVHCFCHLWCCHSQAKLEGHMGHISSCGQSEVMNVLQAVVLLPSTSGEKVWRSTVSPSPLSTCFTGWRSLHHRYRHVSRCGA